MKRVAVRQSSSKVYNTHLYVHMLIVLINNVNVNVLIYVKKN